MHFLTVGREEKPAILKKTRGGRGATFWGEEGGGDHPGRGGLINEKCSSCLGGLRVDPIIRGRERSNLSESETGSSKGKGAIKAVVEGKGRCREKGYSGELHF